MMNKKVYRVVAKYEFEMVGTSADDVKNTLDVLFDSLVECHSNANTGCDDDFPENFTGTPPKKKSISVVLKR